MELKVVSAVEDKFKGLKENVEEKMKVERRKNTLIMNGIKEGDKDDDLETVKAILNDDLKLDTERHIEEVAKISRFESNKNRSLSL